MPAASTVRLWVLDNVDGFADLYARARLVGYHAMADERDLKVDARKSARQGAPERSTGMNLVQKTLFVRVLARQGRGKEGRPG
jgi:hypothetical protein